jgi:hypothetical protein
MSPRYARRGLDWRGLTAVLLVAGVFSVLAVITVTGVVRAHQLTDTELSALSVVLGTALGAVATYLGSGQTRSYYQSPPEQRIAPRRTLMTEQPAQPGADPGDTADHPDLTPDEFEDVDRDPADADEIGPDGETPGEEADGSPEGVAP